MIAAEATVKLKNLAVRGVFSYVTYECFVFGVTVDYQKITVFVCQPQADPAG
jgi:hypothetical protein